MCSPLLPRREAGKERKKGKVGIKGREMMGKEKGEKKKKARQRLGREGRTGIIFEFGKQNLTC